MVILPPNLVHWHQFLLPCRWQGFLRHYLYGLALERAVHAVEVQGVYVVVPEVALHPITVGDVPVLEGEVEVDGEVLLVDDVQLVGEDVHRVGGDVHRAVIAKIDEVVHVL